METCHLCAGVSSALVTIKDKDQLDTLSFLKATSQVLHACQVCSSCNEKVQMISGLKQAANTTSKAKEQPEEDIDLDELDLLSSYYAENDDPDFVPNASVKAKKLTVMKPSRRKLSTKVELKCQLCEASFTRVIALRRHFLNDHEDIERSEWKCQACPEVLSDKSSLICHFIKTHVAINQCKKCGKKFRLARSLRYKFS